MRTYSTIQGDTWDLISYHVYGDEGFMDILIQANPDQMDTVIFNSDVVLNVPDKPASPPPSASTIAPWRL